MVNQAREKLKSWLPEGYLEAMEAGEVDEYLPDLSGMLVAPEFSVYADQHWYLCHLGIGARLAGGSNEVRVLICRHAPPGLVSVVESGALEDIEELEQGLQWKATKAIREYCEFVLRTGTAPLPSGETSVYDESSAYGQLRHCDEVMKELNFGRWAEKYRESYSHVETEIQTGLFGED